MLLIADMATLSIVCAMNTLGETVWANICVVEP